MKAKILLYGIVLFLGMASAQEKGSNIVIREAADPGVLNPLISSSAVSSYMSELLFSSLLGVDKGSGQFLPLLAKDLPTVSPDELMYTYTLDPDAKWNSGKPVTAEDVIFSVKMLLNPFLDNSHRDATYANIKHVSSPSPGTVVFIFNNPSPNSLKITGEIPIFSKSYFDPTASADGIDVAALASGAQIPGDQSTILETLATKINSFGTSVETYSSEACIGLYNLTSWAKDKEIVLTVNKKHWGRKFKTPKNVLFLQHLETITFKIIKDETQVRNMIMENQFQVIRSLSPALFFELSEIPQVNQQYKFETPKGTSYQYIGMNMKPVESKRPPIFNDLKVRKAFAHLVNVQYLLESTLYGLGMRIPSDFHNLSESHLNQSLKLVSFDVAAAKKLLAEAGWKDLNADGILDKNISGETVPLKIEVLIADNNPQRLTIAESIKNTAKEAGMDITITMLPYLKFSERLVAHQFDAFISGWVSEPNEDSYAQIWLSTNWENGGSNYVGYGDPTTDAVIQEHEFETDPDKRIELSKKIQKSIYDAQPYVFLWAPTERIIVAKKYAHNKFYSVRPGFWVPEWKIAP